MQTFNKILNDSITEALKIKKKASDKTEQPTPTPQKIKAKRPSDSLKVGTVDNIDVYKSSHSTQKRDGEKKARDHGIKDELILKKIKKVFDSGELVPGNKTIIVYKNSKARYDMMIINKENGYITIITFIQGREKDPEFYFTKSRQKQDRIVVESVEYPYIILDEEGEMYIMKFKTEKDDDVLLKLMTTAIRGGYSLFKDENYWFANALEYKREKIAKWLYDVDVNISNLDYGALGTAAMAGNLEMVRILLADDKFQVPSGIVDDMNSVTPGIAKILMKDDRVLEMLLAKPKWKWYDKAIKLIAKKSNNKKLGKYADLLGDD